MGMIGLGWFKGKMVLRLSIVGAWRFGFLERRVLLRDLSFFKGTFWPYLGDTGFFIWELTF